jgi:exopolysaccharide biosynthesis polyprenyl glycosylphosphotransferase
MSTNAQYFPSKEFIGSQDLPEKNDAATRDAAESSVAGKEVLLGRQFIHRLRLEKLRADRSKTPLSIALFLMSPADGNARRGTRHMLKHLCTVTRETDIKGVTDAGTLGLILPDTDETGTRICLEKILRTNGRVRCSVVAATYPDRLFEAVLNQAQGRPDPLCMDLAEEAPYRFAQAVKRGVDILGALFAILLFLPVMLAAAAAIKIFSPGPVIFKQNRLGWRGKKFSCYKFRSMYCHADDRVHREFVTNLIEGRLEKVNQGEEKNPFYKIKDDVRITRVGKILRKLSLDEIPQLFNVLKGDMSLVGPRPPLPYEVEKYEPWHFRRILEAKPGITGLWQVNGRNRTTFEEMVRLDLRYAHTWSLWLDFKILAKTCREVLHPRGAA